MNARLLLCTDLDRTLLPNGEQPESPSARALFARLAARPGVTLVYVTGRHRALVQAALDEYQLPGAVADILFSPSHSQLHGRELAEWILADNLPVRMQLQLHKILWNDEPGH